MNYIGFLNLLEKCNVKWNTVEFDICGDSSGAHYLCNDMREVLETLAYQIHFDREGTEYSDVIANIQINV